MRGTKTYEFNWRFLSYNGLSLKLKYVFINEFQKNRSKRIGAKNRLTLVR